MPDLTAPPIHDPMFQGTNSVLQSRSWTIFFQTIGSMVSATVGPTGPAGPANIMNIGTVTSGTTASATITGGSPNQTLNLVLPQGDTGPTGPQGPVGPTGSGGSDFLIMQVFGG